MVSGVKQVECSQYQVAYHGLRWFLEASCSALRLLCSLELANRKQGNGQRTQTLFAQLKPTFSEPGEIAAKNLFL